MNLQLSIYRITVGDQVVTWESGVGGEPIRRQMDLKSINLE